LKIPVTFYPMATIFSISCPFFACLATQGTAMFFLISVIFGHPGLFGQEKIEIRLTQRHEGTKEILPI